MAKRVVLAVLLATLLVPASSQAAFPGANGKIAFVRSGDIWTMNPDGTGQVNLTNSAVSESNPAWSPDGNRIAFDRITGSGFNRELYVMFADGTGVTQIVANNQLHGRADPAWSPNGDQLVYVVQGGPFVSKINLDGTGETNIDPGAEDSYDPEWSPDGTKIAYTTKSGSGNPCYYDVVTVNPDGSSYFNVTQCLPDDFLSVSENPNWSPDGTRIAFVKDGLETIKPDGTDRVTLGVSAYQPAWSPDGAKIAYGTTNLSGRIKVVNSNGTNIVDLTDGYQPDWQPLPSAGPEADVLSTITDSPDPIPAGGILTYTASAKNLVGPDDASGVTLTVNLPASVFFVSATPTQGSCAQAAGTVTCNLGNLPQGSSASATIQVEPQTPGTINAAANVSATETDPVPGNNASNASTTVTFGGYPRPKGAEISYAPLVPAYRECDPDAATLTHGPSLAFPSCGSPSQTSGYLTVGTPDANTKAANSVGFVKLRAIGEGPPIDPNNGDQADVGYELNMTDVRNTSDLSDYAGELEVQATLRITDRLNTPSLNAPATGTDTSIGFAAPCTPTASPSIGATCSISTTAEAIVPGMVTERKRAIWALGRVRVFDGGADGDTATGPNTLFAVQGVFVP
jgi:uncharacterized repeat protein (TIGR01451 family)